MKDLTKYFIDLSKCTEEEQKHIFSSLPEKELDLDYEISVKYHFLHFDFYKWYVDSLDEILDKTELTYPEFIKLLEGGESKEVLQVENNGWIKIESELELPNDDEPIWVMIEDCELPELVQPDREADDFYGSDGVIYHSHHITHYQPIIKPKSPKF